MKITITNIKIENFKNFEHLEQPLGNVVQVLGANETGKTTFADAISWCLTGKNSLGETNPNIVPINKQDSSPTVELTISFDNNKTATIARVYQAKFNRAKEYMGEHQTVCFINGVKSNIRDYETWIDNHICNKEIFRLVHDVRYFTENITTTSKEKAWEIQRRLLFGISGIKSDIDLAKKRKKFAPLIEHLQTYDNANQCLLALKTTLKTVETQINEINQNIEWRDNQARDMRKQLNGAVWEDIKAEIDNLESANQKEIKKWQKNAADYKAKIQQANLSIETLMRQSAELAAKARISSNHNNELIAKCNKLKETCPTCGAPLDKNKVVEQRNEIQKQMAACKENYTQALEKRNKVEAQIAEIKATMNGWQEPVMPQGHQDYMDKLKALNIQLGICEEATRQEKQIVKWEMQRSSLLDNKAMLQQDIDLCQEFIAYKCEQATKTINALFDGVTFELFRANKTNDEVKDCCDIFWQGVPYESLSYSTKFIVGLKIAQAFQKYYNINMPLIVDNAESIDFGADWQPEQQTILLIKKEETCAICGGHTSRKQANGLWKCSKCGYETKKRISIETSTNR